MSNLFSNQIPLTLEKLKSLSPRLVKYTISYMTRGTFHYGFFLGNTIIKDWRKDREKNMLATWGFIAKGYTQEGLFKIEFELKEPTFISCFLKTSWEEVLKSEFSRGLDLNLAFYSYLTHSDPVVRYFVKSQILPLIQSA